ncbi:MAG: GtrA family protein [Nitrososphaerota archaeon]|nr:GtrA family protein [Nitrososphaerota archaeon]MDG7026248.1 GtrA family protein [Nitrososphaerota archaeon]
MDPKKILKLSYWLKFIKFNVVGLSGVLVNEGLLLTLVYEGVYYLRADAVAIEAAILSNFFLNDYWTFRDRRHGHIIVRLLKFNALMVVGLVVNLAILYAFTAYLEVNYAVSNLFGIAVAFLLRYWLSVRFTWIKKEEASTSPA